MAYIGTGGTMLPALIFASARAAVPFTPLNYRLSTEGLHHVTGTVEFACADAEDAALVCVPPYHIAAVGAALSNFYAG